MKDRRFIGYTFHRTETGSSGIWQYHFTFYVVKHQRFLSRPEVYITSEDLFTFHTQAHRREEKDSLSPSDNLFHSYAPTITHLRLTGWDWDVTKKLTSAFLNTPLGWKPSRAVVRLLKRLKAVRIIYSSEHHCHIPYQFRRQADLYVKAVKAGLTVTKEAA